jgi:hypothetical protein
MGDQIAPSSAPGTRSTLPALLLDPLLQGPIAKAQMTGEMSTVVSGHGGCLQVAAKSKAPSTIYRRSPPLTTMSTS